MSACKFCGQDKKLIKAHIIPESLYQKLVDDKGHSTKLLSLNPTLFPKRIPNGIYDTNLVCEDCERRFTLWDDYACEFLRNNSPDKNIEYAGEKLAYVYGSADCEKLKLFFMSLLWRAHATTHPFFERVRLGCWENNLKERLLANNAGTPEEYTVVFCRYPNLFLSPHFSPFPERYNGVNCYRFYLYGFRVSIKVDKRPFSNPLGELGLGRSSELVMVSLDPKETDEMALMKKIVKCHAKTKKEQS